jgi:hypothetical protein
MVFKKEQTPWNKGKTNIYTQEVLESNRQKHIGKTLSQECRDKISQTLKGRKFSEEHKKKIGDAVKQRKLLGKTYDELYGEEKAENIKYKMSNNWAKELKGNFPKETLEKKKQNMLGEKNPMYGIKGELSPFWKGGANESSKRSYKNNVDFRLKKLIRHRVLEALNRQLKGGKIEKSIYYGIDIPKIVDYLKSQLPDDFMSGEYDIHHIEDLIKFDLNNQEELVKAFAPENHKIILRDEHKKHHIDNRIKNSNIPDDVSYSYHKGDAEKNDRINFKHWNDLLYEKEKSEKDTTYSNLWLFRKAKMVPPFIDKVGSSSPAEAKRNGVEYFSEFNPLVSQNITNFWSDEGNVILDPFAGRTRGIVSGLTHRKYYGFEISPHVYKEVMDVIMSGKDKFEEGYVPIIYNDDSFNVDKYDIPNIDTIFSCPPYWNLEKYESVEGQLSDIEEYSSFLFRFKHIMEKCISKLKDNGYVCLVVGDFRKDEKLISFETDTIKIIESMPKMVLWDKIILQNIDHGWASRKFGSIKHKRIVAKVTEYLLVFKKINE